MGTRFSTLGDVGSLAAPPGSRDWAVAVRLELQAALSSFRGSADHLQTMLALMRRHEGWRQLAGEDRQPFATYEAFCAAPVPLGLGWQAERLDQAIGRGEPATQVLGLLPQLTAAERADVRRQLDALDGV